MKIVALNGSHRGDKGSTHFFLKLLAEGAAKAGADFEIVVLAREKINRCLGCFQCSTESHMLHCVWEEKDDVCSIQTRMREADLIIYASPIYIFTISSLLKTFLERFMSTASCRNFRVSGSGLFFHDIDPLLCSKPFAFLVCCDNVEAATPSNAISYFKTFSRFMDAPMVGQLVRPTAQSLYAYFHSEITVNNPLADGVIAAYLKAGEELALLGRITRRTQSTANQSILPIPPLFRLLMKLPLRNIKVKATKRAKQHVQAAPSTAEDC